MYGKLAALSVLQTLVWGSSAFVIPTPKVQRSSALQSTPPMPGSSTAPGALSGPSPYSSDPTYGAGGGMQRVGWDDPESVIRVEGSTLRTWTFRDTSIESVTCLLETEGRPLNADVQLWIGPDWTPFKLKVYSEDGRERPVQTLIGTRNRENALAVRNTNSYEFPMNAACAYAKPPLSDMTKQIPEMSPPVRVQGGAVYTTPFPSSVQQVQVMLNTDGRQLNARVELLNGPNNIKQTFEVFTNNGQANPLYVVMEAPGAGNVVRIVNLATVEFPCEAWISEA